MIRAVAATALALGALTVPAATAATAQASTAPEVHNIGSCRATGQNAECITGGGNISRPAQIWVYVHAVPDQKVDVYWYLDCFKGTALSSRDGNFTAMTPIRSHQLPLPDRNPSSCIATASVSLHTFGARGTVKVWLGATKR